MSPYQRAINLSLLFMLASCNNHKEQNQEIAYLGNRLFLFESLSSIKDSLDRHGIHIEYDDSFSGIDKGIDLYSFQQQKDSLILLTRLFFEKNELNGVTVDFTSKKISDPNSFLDKVRSGTMPIISNEIVVDTSTIYVNHLESSTGKLFRLKVYSKHLHDKLPFIF